MYSGNQNYQNVKTFKTYEKEKEKKSNHPDYSLHTDTTCSAKQLIFVALSNRWR